MGNLGMTEILMILVIALIIFGPRKLPELGRTLGQSLAHFRRASEDFKRQWEEEVDLEQRQLSAPPAPVEPAGNIAEASAQQEETQTQEWIQELNQEPQYESAASETEQTEPVAAAEPTVAAANEQTVARETKRDWM